MYLGILRRHTAGRKQIHHGDRIGAVSYPMGVIRRLSALSAGALPMRLGPAVLGLLNSYPSAYSRSKRSEIDGRHQFCPPPHLGVAIRLLHARIDRLHRRAQSHIFVVILFSSGVKMSRTATCAPECLVVVCTRNRASQLERCLESLSRLSYPNFDVLVVDNAPLDDSTKEIAARGNVLYVSEPVPGLARARNTGAHRCNSEFLAYLDDDCVPEPSWLSELINGFSDPNVKAVTGRILLDPVEAVSETPHALLDNLDLGPEPITLSREDPRWFEKANFGGIGNGGNMAFHRELFDVWPGFDERLGRGSDVPGGEEHYAFFNLVDRGYKVAYNPAAVVRHQVPSSDALRTRQLQDSANAIAYMTFLFCGQPRYRRQIARYVGEALVGRRRAWRRDGDNGIVAVQQKLRDGLLGFFMYLLSGFQRKLKSRPRSVAGKERREIAPVR